MAAVAVAVIGAPDAWAQRASASGSAKLSVAAEVSGSASAVARSGDRAYAAGNYQAGG